MVLAILAVESLRAPAAPPGPAAAAAERGEDTLVLRLGRIPEPGEEPALAGAESAPVVETTADDAASAPATMDPAQYYVVRAGDTLSSIAREQLGSALLANELARINRLDDPNQLEVGQILYLR